MRNFSYPEATLVLSIAGVMSGLCYLILFQPALEQIRDDRRATQALLFELATADRKTPAQNEAPKSVEAEASKAARPELVQVARGKRPQIHAVKAPARGSVLDLDEGSDPISGLDL